MQTRPYMLALAVAATALATAAPHALADKKHQFRFVGIHPIPKPQGGGVCHIQAPHVHVYAAIDAKVQFRDHDGWQHFVGDPVAYGWDGDKHAYYGHHPVPVNVIVGDDHPDTEYCYLDGPHYHAWAPPADLHVELRGGAYWYTGDFPPAYAEAKVTYDPIDVVYQPIVYERPVVEVSVAPPGWYGAIVVAPGAVVVPVVVDAPRPPPPRPPPRVVGGAHVHGGVEVRVPSVRVEVQVPTVQIGIGAGVVIGGGGGGGHGHKHGHKPGKRKGHR